MKKHLTLLVALCFLSVSTLAAELPKGIMKLDGRAAPALRLKDLDGTAYDLATHRGQWMFVHFWAAWCGPCRKEMPKVQALSDLIDSKKMGIWPINTAEDDDTVFIFLSSVAPDLLTLMDPDGLVTEVWQPRGLPATFFVDPKGRLQYLALGGRDWTAPVYLDFIKSLIGSSR